MWPFRSNPRAESDGSSSGTASPARWLIDWIGGGEGAFSGERVTVKSASRIGAAFACVQAISQDMAKTPCVLYKRLPNGGKERATSHPLYRLMHDRPCPRFSSFEWTEMLAGHQEWRGNAYALIQRDGRGRPTALWPLHVDSMTVLEAPDRELFYKARFADGRELTIPESEIVHFRDRTEDGILGISRLAAARETIGGAQAMQRHGGRFFANGAKPGGLLIHPSKLSTEAANGVREQWERLFKGADNAHKVAVLAENFKYEQLGMSNDDAQWIDAMKLSRSEIAAFWRMPPHMIGDLDRATFTNIEHQRLAYVGDTLMPRLVRWEKTLNHQLLTEAEQGEYFFEYLLDGLLRGDTKTRWDIYIKALQNGVMCVDEVRERENMNPIPGGDVYRVQVNTAPLTADPSDQAGGAPQENANV